jgi:hypothetical protein
MPQENFDVESYTAGTIQVSTAPEGAWRFIALTSPDIFHGIRSRARLYFVEGEQPRLGVVFNVDQPNYNGLLAYAFLWKADFAEWYDIVRGEAPIKCGFNYPGPFDPTQPMRDLLAIQLYTGQPEPPGEGSADLQAKLFSG